MFFLIFCRILDFSEHLKVTDPFCRGKFLLFREKGKNGAFFSSKSIFLKFFFKIYSLDLSEIVADDRQSGICKGNLYFVQNKLNGEFLCPY